MPPESSNSFFHNADGTGTTEKPEATNIPIHNPYPNPPLHQPFSQEKADTLNQKRKKKKEYLFTSFALTKDFTRLNNPKPHDISMLSL